MKCSSTRIVKTQVTNREVIITVQPLGTDEGYDQVTIQVVPRDRGVFLSFGGLQSRVVEPRLVAANQAELQFVLPQEVNMEARQMLTLTPRQRNKITKQLSDLVLRRKRQIRHIS